MAVTCVALVDDEAPVRRALGRLLRLAGHEVLSFESGQEFLDSLPARRPDCVLLDIQMPGLTRLAGAGPIEGDAADAAGGVHHRRR